MIQMTDTMTKKNTCMILHENIPIYTHRNKWTTIHVAAGSKG